MHLSTPSPEVMPVEPVETGWVCWVLNGCFVVTLRVARNPQVPQLLPMALGF